MKICYTCGKKKGTKEPGAGATWHADICDYCHEQSYVTEPRDFGIYQDGPEDQAVDELKKMFGMTK